MADIKRLLNKKGWTGRELGILELANMCSVFRQALDGKEPTPLFTPAEFSKMLSTLTDRQQAKTYNGYISIHDWLRVSYNIAQTHEQQAQLQFRTLEGYIERAALAEQVYTYMEQLPAIMTQKEYDETRAERLEAYLNTEDGEETYSDLYNLFCGTVYHYLRQLEREPGKPNPLKAIRKKYVSQPVKSPVILSRYNEVMERGYYTIEDGSGRRSDEMTPEEWQAAITTPAMREILDKMNSPEGKAADLSGTLAFDRVTARSRVLFSGGTEKDAEKAQQLMDYEKGYAMPVKWHRYTEPPEDLTKWDIIEQELYEEIYPADIDGSGDRDSDSNYIASIADIMGEFPELVTAMLTDIDKTFFKGKLGLVKYSPEEWTTRRWAWHDLYKMGFYGLKEIAEADTTLFDGNKRALLNGIAILRESTFKSDRIDERGYYVEPKIGGILGDLESFTLAAFFPEAEDYANTTEIVENARTTLLQSYYYIKGYNLALELIGDYYEVPDMRVFKINLPALTAKIEALNSLVPILYVSILYTDYADEELKQKKLQVLKDFFQPLPYKEMEIPAENIQEATELFKDFKAFADGGHAFNSLLCDPPETEDGEGETE